MDELADRAAASTRSSCGSATSRTSTRSTGRRSRSRNLVACLRRGRRPVRLGRPRPDAAGAPRRPVAGRHRRRRLDLPGAARARRRPRRVGRARTGRYEVRDRRRRHRHRRPDRARPRSPPTRWRCRSTRSACRIGDSDLPAGDRRRRLDGHVVLGLGGRQGVPRAASRERARRRCPPDGADGRGRRAGRRRTPTSSPGTRSAPSSPRSGSTVDTGEIRVPRLLGVFAVGRIVNADDGPLPAHRRHDHGPVDGAARGDACIDPRFGD